MHDYAFVFREKLIMVMGMQRSGTSALTEALGQDPGLRVETESEDNEFYDNYVLRPEPEIRTLLWSMKRRVLLKPISEVQHRSVLQTMQEFSDYGTRVAWIYRDPVNVWHSNRTTFGMETEKQFKNWAKLWVEGNLSVLEALETPFRERIALVRYEDLIKYRETFWDLCQFLAIEARNNIFWQADKMKGRKAIDPELRRRIEDLTYDVFARLDANRLMHRRQVGSLNVGGYGVRAVDERVRWELEQRDGAKAHLQFLANWPGGVRVEIDEHNAASADSIQLNRLPFVTSRGLTYTAAFWIRSDRPRKLGLTISQGHAPWGAVSEYRVLETTSEWQYVRLEFVSQRDEELLRLHFDLGQEPTAVDVSEPIFEIGRTNQNELHLHGNGRARLHFDPERPEVLRLEPQEAAGGAAANLTDIQLVANRLQLTAGKDYTIAFRARADQPTTAGLAVIQDHEPWTALGFYERVQLGPTWRMYRYDFTATESDDTRLHFDLGETEGPMELAGMVFAERLPHSAQLLRMEGCQAALEYPPDQPGVVRVVLNQCTGREPGACKIFWDGMSTTKGARYVLKFWGRSDATRTVYASVGRDGEPWEHLGIYQRMEFSPEGRDFYYEFVANESAPAYVHFDLAGSDPAVELSDLKLVPGPTALSVEDIRRLREIVELLERGIAENGPEALAINRVSFLKPKRTNFISE